MGFFSIFDVTHKGEVVNLSEMQGNAATVHAQYMPFELLEAAQVLHLTGRMLMTTYNILAPCPHGETGGYSAQPLATDHRAS